MKLWLSAGKNNCDNKNGINLLKKLSGLTSGHIPLIKAAFLAAIPHDVCFVTFVAGGTLHEVFS